MTDCKSLKDAQIVNLILDGHINAFETLVNRYKGKMRRYIYPQVSGFRDGAAIADDLVQDVFVRVYTHLGGFNPAKGSFQGWLYQRARSVTSNFLRKPHHLTDAIDENNNTATVERNAESVNQSLCVEKQLRRLKPEELELFMLYLKEELTQAEIAEIWHCSVRTVKRRVQKLMIKIKPLLAQCL